MFPQRIYFLIQRREHLPTTVYATRKRYAIQIELRIVPIIEQLAFELKTYHFAVFLSSEKFLTLPENEF